MTIRVLKFKCNVCGRWHEVEGRTRHATRELQRKQEEECKRRRVNDAA